MEFKTIGEAKKVTGLGYLGSVNSSAKIIKAEKYEEMTYILYLAPATLSGYNTCAGSTKACRNACLFNSGLSKIHNKINNARIKKTKLFYEEREFFNSWLFAEIEAASINAKRKGMRFSVRLNGTSDISPELFKKDGMTVMEYFNHIQFYDYTKIYRRIDLLNKYPNYDLTYSYNGFNWKECETALNNNMRVAIVFDEIPETYKNYKVIDGDLYDMRYKDEKNIIVGLKYKIIKEKIDLVANPFIITFKNYTHDSKKNETKTQNKVKQSIEKYI